MAFCHPFQILENFLDLVNHNTNLVFAKKKKLVIFVIKKKNEIVKIGRCLGERIDNILLYNFLIYNRIFR